MRGFFGNLLFYSLLFSFDSCAEEIYATDLGAGPDKWASVWVLERSGHAVEITIGDAVPEDGSVIAFDMFSAEYNRTGSSTTYDALMAGLNLDVPAAASIGRIVHEIEIDAFSQSVSQESRVVEHGFRGMQLRYGRDRVTKACYLTFFDTVAAAIRSDGLSAVSSQDLIPDSSCMESAAKVAEDTPTGTLDTASPDAPLDTRVPTLALSETLHTYAGDENILFVDTRETWEFEEGRIPGAINIKLRDVDDSLDQVRDADLVIAYCVKDFRGYEAARAFRKHGINAAIMTPHGMRGWIGEGLPVAGSKGMPEPEALAALKALAQSYAGRSPESL